MTPTIFPKQSRRAVATHGNTTAQNGWLAMANPRPMCGAYCGLLSPRSSRLLNRRSRPRPWTCRPASCPIASGRGTSRSVRKSKTAGSKSRRVYHGGGWPKLAQLLPPSNQRWRWPNPRPPRSSTSSPTVGAYTSPCTPAGRHHIIRKQLRGLPTTGIRRRPIVPLGASPTITAHRLLYFSWQGCNLSRACRPSGIGTTATTTVFDNRRQGWTPPRSTRNFAGGTSQRVPGRSRRYPFPSARASSTGSVTRTRPGETYNATRAELDITNANANSLSPPSPVRTLLGALTTSTRPSPDSTPLATYYASSSSVRSESRARWRTPTRTAPTGGRT